MRLKFSKAAIHLTYLQHALKGRSRAVVRTADAAVATWVVALQTKIPTSPKIREKWGTLAKVA
jgi:hypothetical protein